MKMGAFDYLPKPFTPGEMVAVAKKAWEKRQRLLEMKALSQGDALPAFGGIVGKRRTNSRMAADILDRKFACGFHAEDRIVCFLL
jgi:DNA-binding NtrC family response regulator